MDSIRVELPSGGWAEIRTKLLVADIKAQRQAEHDRGFEDATLDAFALLPRIIKSWSMGDVTDAAIEGVSVDDAVAISRAFADAVVDRPNASTPSSDGSDTTEA